MDSDWDIMKWPINSFWFRCLKWNCTSYFTLHFYPPPSTNLFPIRIQCDVLLQLSQKFARIVYVTLFRILTFYQVCQTFRQSNRVDDLSSVVTKVHSSCSSWPRPWPGVTRDTPRPLSMRTGSRRQGQESPPRQGCQVTRARASASSWAWPPPGSPATPLTSLSRSSTSATASHSFSSRNSSLNIGFRLKIDSFRFGATVILRSDFLILMTW